VRLWRGKRRPGRTGRKEARRGYSGGREGLAVREERKPDEALRGELGLVVREERKPGAIVLNLLSRSSTITGRVTAEDT